MIDNPFHKKIKKNKNKNHTLSDFTVTLNQWQKEYTALLLE